MNLIYSQNEGTPSAKLLLERLELFQRWISETDALIMDYVDIWTCNTEGLNNWAKLIGVDRRYSVPYIPSLMDKSFGFGHDRANFEGTFNTQSDTVEIYLNDKLLRDKVIMELYLTSSSYSTRDINRALQLVYGAGSYTIDCTTITTNPVGPMEITHFLSIKPDPVIIYLTYFGLYLPRPAGIHVKYLNFMTKLYDGRWKHDGKVYYDG